MANNRKKTFLFIIVMLIPLIILSVITLFYFLFLRDFSPNKYSIELKTEVSALKTGQVLTKNDIPELSWKYSLECIDKRRKQNPEIVFFVKHQFSFAGSHNIDGLIFISNNEESTLIKELGATKYDKLTKVEDQWFRFSGDIFSNCPESNLNFNLNRSQLKSNRLDSLGDQIVDSLPEEFVGDYSSNINSYNRVFRITTQPETTKLYERQNNSSYLAERPPYEIYFWKDKQSYNILLIGNYLNYSSIELRNLRKNTETGNITADYIVQIENGIGELDVNKELPNQVLRLSTE